MSKLQRWLDRNFILNFHPHPFSKEVEKLIRELIKEIEFNHPLWTKESSLIVHEIKIYVDAQEMLDNARIEYKTKFGLILLEIGLANMVKNDYWSKSIPSSPGCDEKYDESLLSKREKIRAEMIDVDQLRAQLFHEFGHPLDEANPKFHYTYVTNLSDKQRHFVLCLWNAYIDGRILRAGYLTCRDLKDRTFEAYLDVNPEINKAHIEEVICKVWHSNELTYDDLVKITKGEIPSLSQR
jgi:hypothetical protein